MTGRVGAGSDHRADGPFEPGHVVAADRLGLLGAARGDRAQQPGVLADVPVDAGEAVEEQAVDAGGQVVVAHQGVLQVRVARGAVDGPVHAQVPAHQLGALGRRRVEPVREYMERKGFILQEKFIFIDGRSGAQIYSEALREERLYNQNDNTPALSSYFELMDEIIPRFLSTLSTQRVRGSRVLIK